MTPAFLPEVQAYNRLMANSFQRFMEQPIVAGAGALTDADLATALFNAPQAIISHGTEADPVFRYANATALRLWEMDWDDFVRMPSRLSAADAPDVQADRNQRLKAALEQGFVDGLTGIRLSSSARRFEIRDTVLWNVVDSTGTRHGQAAFIRRWQHL